MRRTETLHNLDILVPRIQFGKAVPSPLAKELRHEDDGPDPTSFPFIKRDLIRLLGTLSFRNKVIQDRIRRCGGIEVILNHSTVDEKNPCKSVYAALPSVEQTIDMREHAIFALRNLLEDNADNQEAVRGIRPLRDFDSNGILKDLGPRK
jgi:ataxin-10